MVHWLSMTLSLRKTSQESTSLERKSYLDCSLDTLCTREEFGRVTYWSQTLRSWRRWTHRKSTQKHNAKEVIFPKGKFIFPVADGRIKFYGNVQIRGERHVDFLGQSEGSLPLPQDSLLDAGEARNGFWSISGNVIYRQHVEPRLKYIAVSRTAQTNLDVMQAKDQEICLVLLKVSPSSLY